MIGSGVASVAANLKVANIKRSETAAASSASLRLTDSEPGIFFSLLPPSLLFSRIDLAMVEQGGQRDIAVKPLNS